MSEEVSTQPIIPPSADVAPAPSTDSPAPEAPMTGEDVASAATEIAKSTLDDAPSTASLGEVAVGAPVEAATVAPVDTELMPETTISTPSFTQDTSTSTTPMYPEGMTTSSMMTSNNETTTTTTATTIPVTVPFTPTVPGHTN